MDEERWAVEGSAPPEIGALLLIARRGALEALRDRMTVTLSLIFAIGLPLVWVFMVLAPLARDGRTAALGATVGVFVLLVGMTPSMASVGIAAGQFAGELEQGILAPLLATPASNLAIFGGKVLGSILPALLMALVAEATYAAGVALVLGPARLALVPAWLALGMLALVPAVALLAATVASLISSRVRTYNAAQQVTGLALLPLWGVLFWLATGLSQWGPPALAGTLAALLALDLVLIVAAARTWRREEVLAQR